MPDREESDSPRVPAGRGRQLSPLARVAIVVGIPFASAFLRVPLWFTLLLLLGLAGFLFVGPHLPRKKPQLDPRQAWLRLMASFMSLQSAYADLQASPSNAAALKQFSTLEQKCLSLLASRADCNWGPDSQYAAKIEDEISTMSAAVRAMGGNPAPTQAQAAPPPAEAGEDSTSADPGAVLQPGSPAATARPEIPTSGGLLDLILASEGTTTRSGGPMSSTRPAAPAPAQEESLALASMGAAVQPDRAPLGSAESLESAPADAPVLVLANGCSVVQPENPTPAPRTDDSVLAMERVPTSANAVAAVPRDSSEQVTRVEPAPQEKKQMMVVADAGTASQTDSALPSTRQDAPVPAEEQSLTRASGATAARVATSPLPTSGPEAATPAVREDMAPMNDETTSKTGCTSPSTRLDAPIPVERQDMTPASAAAPVRAGTNPVLPATTEVLTPEEKQEPAPTSEDADVRPGEPAATPRHSAVDLAGKRLTPYVWLPGSVEDAAAFYLSIFKNSLVADISRYPGGACSPTGIGMSATVCLDGQELVLLNGGSTRRSPEAFSLLVRCVDQAEVDYYWQRLLSGGGEESSCGWLKDRFGVSWQVIPDALLELLNDRSPQRAARVSEAMLKMKKIDIAALREAVGQPEAVAS